MHEQVVQGGDAESRALHTIVSTVILSTVSMMLRCMIVKTVELVDCIDMRKTDCFGKTRLVPYVPS